MCEPLGIHLVASFLRDRAFPHEIRPRRNVERDARQRLVHRAQRVAVAADAALVAQRLGDRLAHRDAGILDGMMLVDMEIAHRLHVEIDQRMSRELFEHMIEKARSEEHTSELQSLMRISYAVFCLKKKKNKNT